MVVTDTMSNNTSTIASFDDDSFNKKHVEFLSQVEIKLSAISKSLNSFILQNQPDNNKYGFEKHVQNPCVKGFIEKQVLKDIDDGYDYRKGFEHDDRKINMMVITPDRIGNTNGPIDNEKPQSIQYGDGVYNNRILFENKNKPADLQEKIHHIADDDADMDTTTITLKDEDKPISSSSISSSSCFSLSTDNIEPPSSKSSISSDMSYIDERKLDDSSNYMEAYERLLEWKSKHDLNILAEKVSVLESKNNIDIKLSESSSSFMQERSVESDELINLAPSHHSSDFGKVSTNIISIRNYCRSAKSQLEDAISACDQILNDVYGDEKELSHERDAARGI